MADKTTETKTSETTTMGAPQTRSIIKTFALGAGAAATGTVAANAVTAGVKSIYTWAKGEKKDAAQAAFGGGSGLLKLK